MAEQHQHRWEGTGITHWAYGRRWAHGSECYFCPDCGHFSRKIRLFLDGRLYKTQADVDRANEDAEEQYRAEKRAWLHEHYPERAVS